MHFVCYSTGLKPYLLNCDELKRNVNYVNSACCQFLRARA